MIRRRTELVDVATLCAGFAEGLHALAQPLTILRTRVDEDFLSSLDALELQRNAVLAVEQIEGLCMLHGYMQELLQVATVEPKFEIANASVLIDEVMEGLRLAIEDAGVILRVVVREGCEPVRVDAMRVRQAISEVVLAVFRFSKAGDVIEVCAHTAGPTIKVVVRSCRLRCDALEPRLRMAMAVTAASVRSQGGAFGYTLNPLEFRIDLPLVKRRALGMNRLRRTESVR